MRKKIILALMMLTTSVLIVSLPAIGGGLSYFLNDPEACTTCHIMNPYYDNWAHSTHHHRVYASCNDCHVLHGGFVRKYMSKGQAATRHTWVFLTRQTPDVIELHPTGSVATIQENCMGCHYELVASTRLTDMDLSDPKMCLDCHMHVPHGADVQQDKES